MNAMDYKEAEEQIEYAVSSEAYNEQHTLPALEEIIRHPKQRYIDRLTQKYSSSEILKIANSNNVHFTTLFQIKKMLGDSA